MNQEKVGVCFSIVQVSALQEIWASEADGYLVTEAKMWATKAAKDYKIITHREMVRNLAVLISKQVLLTDLRKNVERGTHFNKQSIFNQVNACPFTSGGSFFVAG